MLVENELKKLQKFDAAYFSGKSHFEEDGTQNYLVFQTMYRYFKRIAGVGSGNYIYFWKYKGLSDESLDSITASNYKVTLELSFYDTKTSVEFNGSCLKQDKVIFNHGNHVLLEVSESCGKLGAISVTLRPGIISVIYKKSDEHDVANYRPIYYNS